jgi:hypothetical protein
VKLPNAENSYIPPAKILNYLLADDHPKGGSKADFLAAFGFNRDGWQILAQALRTHGASYEVASTTQTIHGMKFTVEGSLETPDGRDPNVRTTWIILNSTDEPRLITAHPLSR